MLKKVDINFLIKSVYYFKEFRNENLKVYNNFQKRLGGIFGKLKQDRESSRSKNSLLAKIILLVSFVSTQVFRLPYYIIQTINLRRSQCENIKSCEAFVIPSNRYNIDDNEEVASQLVHITEAIGGGDVLNLFLGHEQKKKTIILYDPLIESRFWKRSRKFHNEKVFIFDGAYIIFLSLVILFAGIFFRRAEELIFLKYYLKQHKADSKGEQASNFYTRIFEVLVIIAYHKLINRLPKHSTKFLTSNSYLAELLRAYILQNEGSGRITELYHGAISNPTEAWFCSLLSYRNKKKEKKQLLIPQVPNLPELSVLNKKYFIENNLSINPYLNFLLYKNKKLYGSYKNYALNQLKQLGLNPDNKGLILSIYGATNINDLSFFYSSEFKSEIEILDKIILYFSNKKLDVQILYAVHPANTLLPQIVVDIFKKRRVHVLYSSVFTYFITDYCISNISSCLFELNWLGAKCFSPMIKADRFYCKNYLEKIHHPESDGIESLEKALYGCLEAGFGIDSKSYIEKFNVRLKMIKSGNIN